MNIDRIVDGLSVPSRHDHRHGDSGPGTGVEDDAVAGQHAGLRHGESTQRPMTLPPYGLEAYAVLRWPDRIVRCDVERSEGPDPVPVGGGVLVLLRAVGDP